MSTGAKPLPSDWILLRAMVGIGMLCALVIALIFQVTMPIVTQNKAEALEQAIFKVLPQAEQKVVYGLNEKGEFIQVGSGFSSDRRVYAAYDRQGKLVGFAIEAQGMGYQDVIHLLYGYSPVEKAIVGIEILASRETPGLGDRIRTDREFLDNFKQLEVALTADQQFLVHPIQVVKGGGKTKPWQIDSITGATVSSQAIGHILRHSTAFWIPRLEQQKEVFKVGYHQ